MSPRTVAVTFVSEGFESGGFEDPVEEDDDDDVELSLSPLSDELDEDEESELLELEEDLLRLLPDDDEDEDEESLSLPLSLSFAVLASNCCCNNCACICCASSLGTFLRCSLRPSVNPPRPIEVKKLIANLVSLALSRGNSPLKTSCI